MCRKMIYFLPFVLVLSLAGTATAQEVDLIIRSPDQAMPVIDGVIEDLLGLRLLSVHHQVVDELRDGPGPELGVGGRLAMVGS